ncbi:MAG: ABC transporter permease [Chloroflexi bacterium]|nr:ABC transporter permease [Chloroflexota bacterium]
MSGYRELLEKEIVEAWRTYRLAGLAGLYLVLGIGVAVFTRGQRALVRWFAPPEYEIGLSPAIAADVVSQLVLVIIQLGAVMAILVTMGAVAGERERGILASVLVKPVSRAAVIAAKWVALAMQFAVAVGLATLGAWLYTGVLVEPVPVAPWAQLAVVIWLATMVQVSITLLGSVLFRSPLAAGAFGFLGLVGLTLARGVPTLAPWLPAGLADVATALALEESSPDLDPTRTIAISIVVIAALVAAAWLWFRREEI